MLATLKSARIVLSRWLSLQQGSGKSICGQKEVVKQIQTIKNRLELGFTEKETQNFITNGYIIHKGLFSREECEDIKKYFNSGSLPEAKDWTKGRIATSKYIYNLASQDKIICKLKALIGNDIILWGVKFIRKKQKQKHLWHVDIESSNSTGNFVSVWIGLDNCTRKSSLNIISKSHNMQNLQNIIYENDLNRKNISDRDILELSRQFNKDAMLIKLDITDGDAFFFNGKLWHSSYNKNRKTRIALLLQYASSDSKVRIPDLKQLDWPFKFKKIPLPPTILVSGKSIKNINKIVQPPKN